MAIPKVCGIETEYGILSRGVDLNPVSASALLISSYMNQRVGRIGWDFAHERPGSDARGFSMDYVQIPDVEYQLVNTVLENGARYYVDHAHPEISTPECRSPMQCLVYDRAAEEIVRHSMDLVNSHLEANQEVVLYKNNSDGKGNSYGCHENYLLDRNLPFGRLVAQITPHFVTRQIFCGAGKVGCESPEYEPDHVPYQISQRADFFEEEVGLETTLKRPIVNTRDEPHCDPQKYRRLHVIVGDANLSETATFLKLGTTAIVLAMIEDGAMDEDLEIVSPVECMRRVSYDLTLKETLPMRGGRRLSALDIQWLLYESARGYQKTRGLECVGEHEGEKILRLWEGTLDTLGRDPMDLADTLDWVAKYRIVLGFAERHGLSERDPKLKAIDLQYSDMRRSRGLAPRAGMRTLVSTQDVSTAVDNPPESTRAYFRGSCLKKWPASVAAANWDSMVFDVEGQPLQRVPMNEPLRGTKDLVGTILESSTSVEELLEQLME